MILSQKYFYSASVTELARDLIGKELHSRIGSHTAGIVVETEAYSGAVDKASHAYKNKWTPRTSVMFGKPARSYVYLCYGMHHLFNIVVSPEGVADAILIRAVEPMIGMDVMANRRNNPGLGNLTSGPAKLSQAMGITTSENNCDLSSPSSSVWLEEGPYSNFNVISTKRVGVDYAEEDANLLWRFYMKDNKWVSKIP